jgi:hypothetical protein
MSKVDLDVHFYRHGFRSGLALQHSRRKTILFHRSNGILIKGIGKRASHVDLLRLALLVDDAGHEDDAFLALPGRKFRVRSDDESGGGDRPSYLVRVR